MQGDLSASLDQIAWVVTGSVVAGAIGLPPTPWLASRFGLKRLLIWCLILSSATAVMTGFSTSLSEVVFWRVCQSFFGAPIMVLAQTVTLNSFSIEKRGHAMAIWSVALTTGWVFAPTLGAFLVELESWRLIFFILGPLGLAAIFLCYVFLPSDKDDQSMRFDWGGFIALAVFIISVQMIFNRGHRLDWFESTEIMIWSIVSLISLYVYGVHTLTGINSFIRWRCFRDRNLSLGLIITAFFSFISLVPLVLIPTMLENLRGMALITIGLVIMPRGVVQMVTTMLMGAIVNKIDPRIPITCGFLIFALSCHMMASYNLNFGPWDLILPVALQGLGVSMIWMPTFHLLYLTLDPELRTDGATMLGLVYSMSSSGAVALVVTFLARGTQTSNEELVGYLIPGNELLKLSEYSSWNTSDGESLAHMQTEVGIQALMIGYVNVWWLVMIVSLSAIPIALLAKGRKK